MVDKAISNILRSRKSVFPKNFNGEHIDDEFIFQILENANYAPSHKLTQPWLFKIFCKSKKNKLKDEILKLNPQFSDLKKAKITSNFEKTSHVICICMTPNSSLLPEWEEIAATAMAVQNLWISCVGSGIGGYWSTPSYAYKLQSFLSLKEDEQCLGLFYLGKYDADNKRLVKRQDISEKIQWFS